jgi:hypothetical protein
VFKVTARHLLCTGLAIALGCRDAPPPPPGSATASAAGRAGGDTIVARVNGAPITAAELDAALQRPLRDLDRARHALRLKQLEQMIAERVLGLEAAQADPATAFARARDQARIEIVLEPPLPPAIAGETGGRVTEPAAAGSPDNVRASDLPLLLLGTVVRDDPSKNMAVIRIRGALVARNFRPGQRVLDDATLERVERRRVLLRRGDGLEFLPLASAPETATPLAEKTPPRSMPPPDQVTDLRRSDVDRGLRNLAELERRLQRGELDVEGQRLLVVAGFEPGSLYELLGLHERDVLMQVDGEWVSDQHNPLWEALRQRERVRLLVMRGGFPLTFEYVIQ